MRHPARHQDPLRAPLNEILGSQGAVRVLRVLAASKQPMGRTQVARRAELNASGVRRTLNQLAAAGVLETVGSGRSQVVRLRDEHPLSTPLRSLFRAERDLFDRTVGEARRAFADMELPVTAIWIESPDARSPGTVDVGVLADPEFLDASVAAIQRHLEAAEKALQMHFVVRGYTDADRFVGGDQLGRLQSVTLLHGWIPVEWRGEEGGPILTHEDLDRRARRLAQAIAALLLNDPSLVERAREWVDRRLAAADDRAEHELDEWHRILSRLSVTQIQALLTEDTERADRLRQSLPFLDVLSASERAQLMSESGR
jgi:DNA-binding transcriptional ArsR family regulator